ncbi:MAG: GNAT family N-acetyltransferase [bacterium]
MIVYTSSPGDLSPSQLEGFFVGWPKPPSREAHLKMLHQASHVVLAVDDEIGRVVGFVNAISDGVLAAYLPLLEVLPEYQGRGIGKELMRKILQEIGDLYIIDLVCDDGLVAYYEGFGFKPGRTMMIRNYERQAGSV